MKYIIILFPIFLYAQDIIISRGSGQSIQDTTIYYLTSSEGDTLLSSDGDTLITKVITIQKISYEDYNIPDAIYDYIGSNPQCWADKRKRNGRISKRTILS
jgi:hypothetical protein